MIRSILLALTDGPGDDSAKNIAFWLARKEGSHVHGLAVIDITAFEIPMIGSPDGFMPSVVPHSFRESQDLMQEMTSKCRGRLDRFAGQCSARRISCSTETRTGIPADTISQAGIAHDITVISRSGYGSGPDSKEGVDSIVAPVIRNSVRPVLVAGTEFSEESDIRNILIAYDGSQHAARALQVAAELGSRPGTRCTILSVVPTEDAGPEIISPAESFLAHHGIAVEERIEISTKPSSVVRDYVLSGKVDLLIMGAYGHSPIREVIFGSTTEQILSHCSISAILQS